jgi:hypothetical protein
MRMDLHIIRKIMIGLFFLTTLMAELTMFETIAPAQDYATSLPYTPSLSSPGSTINSAVSGSSTPPIGSGNPNPVPANPALLAVPVVGTAPLTVDFYVGLAGTSPLVFYAWNFGDGADSYLPAQPYMLHVYQNPGTYMCQLELVTPREVSTIAFTTITVRPRHG